LGNFCRERKRERERESFPRKREAERQRKIDTERKRVGDHSFIYSGGAATATILPISNLRMIFLQSEDTRHREGGGPMINIHEELVEGKNPPERDAEY
jgi:hypothetical protein